MGFLDKNGLSYLWQKITSRYMPTKALTKAEYNALSEEEKMADVEYIITDDNGDGGGTGSGSGVPSGFIGMWHGTEVPDGWALCDGSNGTPDLRGRFVLGESDDHAMGDTGGSEKVTLTVAQMPEHNHNERIPVDNTVRFLYENGSSHNNYTLQSSAVVKTSGSSVVSTANAGSSNPHSNMPPYYVLAYIMKL